MSCFWWSAVNTLPVATKMVSKQAHGEDSTTPKISKFFYSNMSGMLYLEPFSLFGMLILKHFQENCFI